MKLRFNDYPVSRRKFFGQASCAAIGASTLLSSLVNLKAFAAAALANSTTLLDPEYKALVCVFLSGGNDSFNMLMPRDTNEYSEYATTRSNLAIPLAEMLPIFPDNTNGRLFGLHPSMLRSQQLFNEGKMAFISNIGTLVEPTSKEQFWQGLVKLPLGLYSHSDQGQQWMTGLPNERGTTGWGGRVADIIRDMNTNSNVSMNFSMSGTNVFQTGLETIEFTLDPYDGSSGIYGYGEHDEWNVFDRMRTRAIKSMIDHEYQDMFQKTYVDVIRKSRDGHIQFQEAIGNVPPIQSTFSENYLSKSFQMAAYTMAAHEALGMKRQIIFIDYGGWDHHDEVLNTQSAMLLELDTALGEFSNALQELGLGSQVTTFTLSEFGRTLTSNGNGTDHAWGGNVMVMGDKVVGKNIYGEYPTLALSSQIELGNGVLIPQLSADEYFAELALWFGINPSDLPLIFPTLTNFYQPGSGMPIGFLNS
ncbi:MAG TPA: DUF1501 domain-containing protein [Saprospiraceae bacterium]|nr:DUF1501 domain-containing protein [Saprospiraceae bacterium]